MYIGFMLTKSDLDQIRIVVQEEVEPIKKDIKILKKSDEKIKKDLRTVIDYFDRDSVVLHKKVERIEKHLGMSSN